MDRSAEYYITRIFIIYTKQQLINIKVIFSERIVSPSTAPSIIPRRYENLLLRKFHKPGVME